MAASLAIHLAVLVYFGSQLTDAYRLPEPPPEELPPVEAYLVPPPEELPPPPVIRPEPELRRVEPTPEPEPQPPVPAPPAPVPQPAPPRPTPPLPTPPRPAPPTPAPPSPAPPRPAPPTPAPPRPVAPAPPTPAPAPRPTPPSPAPPAPAPPAPAPVAPITPVKEEDKDKDKPIARATPIGAQPRQVAPNAPLPSDVAPLNMAPVARPPTAAAAAPPAGGANRPAIGGANGDFTVRPQGLAPGTLRGALRGSTVGCDNRNAVALNKTERTVCDERVGERGAKAPLLPVGTELNRDKQRDLGSQADLANRLREWKGAGVPVGTAPTVAGTLGQDRPK